MTRLALVLAILAAYAVASVEPAPAAPQAVAGAAR